MKQRMALSGTTAILLALTGAAQADVTGADVWNNWKAAAESVGQTLTPGSEVQDGDTLTVSGFGRHRRGCVPRQWRRHRRDLDVAEL